MGTADQKERDYFALGFDGESKATQDYAKQQKEKAAAAPAAAAPADGHKH